MVKRRQPLKRGAVEDAETSLKCSKKSRSRRNESVEKNVSSPVSNSRPNGDSETESLLSPIHPRRTPVTHRGGRDSQPFCDGNTPRRGAIGRDDLLLSQTSDCVSEVGWDNRSPGTLRQLQRAMRNGDTSIGTDGIADIVKKLADEEPGLPACSPELVDLWMQKQDEGKRGDSRSQLPPAVLSRGGRQKRGRPSGIKNAVMSKELLQRLASVIQAREGNEESAVTPVNRRSPRVSPKPVSNSLQGETRKTAEPVPTVDKSLELFDGDEDFIGLLASVGDVQREDSESAKTANVPAEFTNKKSESGNDSCENLWDDDDDSFLLKATQELVVAETQGFKDLNSRNTNPRTSTPGVSVPKAGRYTFSLHHDNQTSGVRGTRFGEQNDLAKKTGRRIARSMDKKSADDGSLMPFKSYSQRQNTATTQNQMPLIKNKCQAPGSQLIKTVPPVSYRQSAGQFRSNKVAQLVPLSLQAGSDGIPKCGVKPGVSSNSIQSQQTVKQSRTVNTRNAVNQNSCPVKTNTLQTSHVSSGPAHTLKLKSRCNNMDNKMQPLQPQAGVNASYVSHETANSKTLRSGGQDTKCTTDTTKKVNISISEDLLAALAEPDEILDSQISVGSTDSEECKAVVTDVPLKTTCKSDVTRQQAPTSKAGSCQTMPVVKTQNSKCTASNLQHSAYTSKLLHGEKTSLPSMANSSIRGSHKPVTVVEPATESFLSDDDDLLPEDQLLDLLNKVESQATYKTSQKATTADTFQGASRLATKVETTSWQVSHKSSAKACLSTGANQQTRNSTCQSSSYAKKPTGEVQQNRPLLDKEQTYVFSCSQELCGSPTKYSPEEIERKKQEALKRRQTHELSSSQQKLSFSPTKYSAEEIERKKQEALKKRQARKLSSSQEKESSSPIECSHEEIECKRLVLQLGSTQEKVSSSPTKYFGEEADNKDQEALNRKKTQDLKNSQDTFSSSPTKYSAEEIERKRQEAFKRRQTHGLSSSQEHFSNSLDTFVCSPTKYSAEEIEHKKQEAVKRRQTHTLSSSQEKSSSPTKCSLQEIEHKKLEAVQKRLFKLSSSQEKKLSSSPTKHSVQETDYIKQEVCDKKETKTLGSSQDIFSCSPTKCSQDMFEQKKQEALKKRETSKLKNSQDRLLSSPTKNSLAEGDQEVLKRYQTLELQSSQDKASLSPTKYSLQEIQRKKQEALKRRQNRLKLHPKVKAEQKRHS